MTVAEGVAIGLGFLAIVAPDFWPKMPKSLSYTIAGIGLCWLTYSLILAVQNETGMKLQQEPLIAIILGAALIAGGIFWHISRLESHSDLEKAPAPTATKPPSSYHLSDEQRKTFAERAAVPKGKAYLYTIDYLGGCVECKKYAESLSELIGGIGGWSIGTTPQPLYGRSIDLRGLNVAVADKDQLRAGAVVFLKALDAAEIKYELYEETVHPSFDFTLYIGPYDPTAAMTTKNQAVARAGTKSQLDGTIKLECIDEKFDFPANGKLWELIASDNNSRTLSFQQHWMTDPAYRENTATIPTRGGFLDKCRISNFGTAPVFNVKISAQVEFSEHIKIDERRIEQRSVDVKQYEFMIPQIDPGGDGKVDFYMWNTTKFIVSLIFPDTVELQRLGSIERETVRLIPAYNAATLWPPEPSPR